MDFTWNWSYVCPTGLTPWDSDDNFLSPCFQQICLQLPMLFLFAIISAFYVGNLSVLIYRNRTQHFLISIRILISFLIISLHFYTIFSMVVKREKIWPIDIALMGFQIVSWSIHIGFLLVLRHHGDLSHRGPVSILVIWIALALLSSVWLKSAIAVTNANHETPINDGNHWINATTFFNVFPGYTILYPSSKSQHNLNTDIIRL